MAPMNVWLLRADMADMCRAYPTRLTALCDRPGKGLPPLILVSGATPTRICAMLASTAHRRKQSFGPWQPPHSISASVGPHPLELVGHHPVISVVDVAPVEGEGARGEHRRQARHDEEHRDYPRRGTRGAGARAAGIGVRAREVGGTRERAQRRKQGAPVPARPGLRARQCTGKARRKAPDGSCVPGRRSRARDSAGGRRDARKGARPRKCSDISQLGDARRAAVPYALSSAAVSPVRGRWPGTARTERSQ